MQPIGRERGCGLQLRGHPESEFEFDFEFVLEIEFEMDVGIGIVIGFEVEFALDAPFDGLVCSRVYVVCCKFLF